MPKHLNPWPWYNTVKRHVFRPSVHHRPPFPMTTQERLYEVRKRHRKTEIRSERVEIDLTLGHEFCRFCLDLEDGKCLAACSPIDFCPYSEELAAYKRRGETKARFHRMSRKERLYERRKRKIGRGILLRHTYDRTKHPVMFRALSYAIYLGSRARYLACRARLLSRAKNR